MLLCSVFLSMLLSLHTPVCASLFLLCTFYFSLFAAFVVYFHGTESVYECVSSVLFPCIWFSSFIISFSMLVNLTLVSLFAISFILYASLVAVQSLIIFIIPRLVLSCLVCASSFASYGYLVPTSPRVHISFSPVEFIFLTFKSWWKYFYGGVVKCKSPVKEHFVSLKIFKKDGVTLFLLPNDQRFGICNISESPLWILDSSLVFSGVWEKWKRGRCPWIRCFMIALSDSCSRYTCL